MPDFSVPDAVFAAAAERIPTPFYLYDEAGIRREIAALREAFAWSPGFMEYFAVKALPNPHVLRIFTQEGFGLDCASACELLLAERAGARGRIMFSANDVPHGEYALARDVGAVINLDDESDIRQLTEECGVPEVISARYNPGGSLTVGNDIMGHPEESKFGWTRPQLTRGLRRLRELGAKRFGLHAFLSSNTCETGYYPALAALLFRTADELARETGLTPDFVNLSGGIGVPYRPGEQSADVRAIGAGVERAYRRVFGEPKAGNVRVCTELGRHMTAPHGWLVTRAIHHKEIYRSYIGVDASTGNLPRPAIYGAYHHISVVGKRDVPATKLYDVVGSLCENNDKFAIDRRLPPIEEGDLLLIHDAGAHCFSMGHRYNGRLGCAEALLTENGEVTLIRRAETPEDYFATLL